MKEFWNLKAKDVTDSLSWVSQRYLSLLPLALDQSHSRVLELGCGIGTIAAELHRKGATVTAVDFSDEMIRRARELHGEPPGLRFVQADICSMALGQQFDLICGKLVLHEIDQSRYGELLGVLDEHLAPGGCGYFLENSYFNPMFRLFREHLVGRFGVPKYGSISERPFDKARWSLIQERFNYSALTGEISFLLEHVDLYVLKSRWTQIRWLCERLDRGVTKVRGGHRLKSAFSYFQTVYFSQTRPSLRRER